MFKSVEASIRQYQPARLISHPEATVAALQELELKLAEVGSSFSSEQRVGLQRLLAEKKILASALIGLCEHSNSHFCLLFTQALSLKQRTWVLDQILPPMLQANANRWLLFGSE